MGYSGAIAVIAGLLTAPWLPVLPQTWAVALIIVMTGLVSGFITFRSRGRLNIAAWLSLYFIFGFAWSAFAVQIQQDSRWPVEKTGEVHSVTGRIADLPAHFPEYTRFTFEPAAGNVVQGRVLVYWYRSEVVPQAGQVWRLPLKLKPPRGTANFAGFDRERWLFAKKIAATGVVQPQAELLTEVRFTSTPVTWVRSQLRQRIRAVLADHPQTGLILGLALGDRSGISSEQWQRLQTSGTGHLLAISGLHIGLAGLFGFWLFRGLGVLLPAGGVWNPQRLGWLGSIITALVYLLLSGTVLSASRAMLMLAVAVAALLLRRNLDYWFAYLLALLVTLLIWPLSSLTPGFWLSFGAVGLLIYAFRGRSVRKTPMVSLIRAQLVLGVGLLPLTIGWFHYSSTVAALANLIAVPLLSLLVVPLVLCSVLMLGIPGLGGMGENLISLTADLLGWFDSLIVWGSDWNWSRVFWPTAGAFQIGVAMLGAIWLLAPKGWPVRGLGVLLMVPLMLPRSVDLLPGELELLTLDVGQGMALVVQTAEYSMIYDTGPGDGQSRHQMWSTVVPNLTRGRPDRVVISHADLDHAGGLQAVSEFAPAAEFIISAPDLNANQDCRNTRTLSGLDGFAYTILHPNPGLPYLGNDSSCVLLLESEHYRLILPGDIGEAVEARLLAQFEALPEKQTVILIPHHGSLSSSTTEFVNAVDADLALVSAGFANRFRLPRQAVLDRYHAVGSRVLNTADCGAIRSRFQDQGIQLSSAREAKPAVWRYPPAAGCP